jgi:hypothetical protein
MDEYIRGQTCGYLDGGDVFGRTSEWVGSGQDESLSERTHGWPD